MPSIRSWCAKKPLGSLFLRVFASIMAIVVIILLVQVLVVAVMFAIQTYQFEKAVFESFRENLQAALNVGVQSETVWDLRSIGPALRMAADDRVSGLILRNSQGDTVLTFGKTPHGTTIPEFVLTIEHAPPAFGNDLPEVSRVYLKSIEEQALQTVAITEYPAPVREQDIVGTIMLYADPSETVLLGSVDVLVFSPMNYAITALLLRRMIMAFIITIPIGLIIAFIGSQLVARAVSAHAAQITRALESVASGRYQATDTVPTMKELAQISDSVDRMAEQLASHERMRQQWLRGIAHDLNTPVTALKLSIESAIDGVVPIDSEVLQRMKDELEELERRVGAVMMLASLEAPDFRIHLDAIDVLDFTDEVLRTALSGRSVALELGCDRMIGDRRLLVLALRELVQNADKYGTQGCPIAWKVLFDAEHGMLTMHVSNQGVIAPDLLNRLFEPWFRADASRSMSGSGMGLSIVRHVMELHGGSARISQADGTITVTLQWPQTDTL